MSQPDIKHWLSFHSIVKVFAALTFVCLFFTSLTTTVSAATLLTDDFTGTTIDTTKWTESDTGSNVNQNGSLVVTGNTTWNGNGVRTVSSYDRSAGDLTIEADLTFSDCSVSNGGVLYGPWNAGSLGTGTIIFNRFGGTFRLWAFATSVNATGVSCTNGVPINLRMVIYSAGGVDVFIDGSLTANASLSAVQAPNSFTNYPVSLQQFASTSTVTFDNVVITGTDPAPTISTLSPADNATNVALSSNLVVNFSEAVTAQTGNVSLYTAGGTLVQAFNVTSDISGSGTAQITLNPTSNLSSETSYYVLIDDTAFDDAGGNSFAGISSDTTWSFTTISTKPQIVFDGDSLTLGTCATGGLNYPNQTVTLLGGSSSYDSTNLGVSSRTIATMLANASANVDSLYSSDRTDNYVAIWGGTNDLYFGASDTTTYNNIVSYAQGRRTAGFKVIVYTILPRSAGSPPAEFETYRQSINTSLRANWASYADGLADVASDSRLGDSGDELNATYYCDQVHLTNTGYGIVANYAAAAINQIISPITISSIVSNPQTTSATISWTTNQAGSTQINYGLTSSYGSSTTETDTSTLVTSHSDTISGLRACTTYHFQAVSTDLNSNEALSTDQTFVTGGCIQSDPTPPVCSNTTPSKAPWLYSAVAQDSSSILLSFGEAADPTDHYALEFGTKSGDYTYGATNIGGKDTRTYLVQSLRPNTTYYFRVRGGNGCATGAWSNEISAKTQGILSLNQLDITESSLEPVTFTPADKTSEDVQKQKVDTPEGYSLNIKVTDKDQQPVVGATVTIHSKVQETTTDVNGVAHFKDVEPGDHKILIAYQNFEGEQSINLTGDVKEFSLSIVVEPKNALTSPLVMSIVGGLLLIIASLVIYIVRSRKQFHASLRS